MAGLQHLFDIYDKRGKEFSDKLFSDSVVITEKLDGSILSMQQNKKGSLDFFKRDDRQPISILDRTIMSLYEKPIDYLEGKLKGKKLPTDLRFGFEYFQNTKPVSISYDRLPKNNLVLTHIKKVDNNGKVKDFIDDPKELKKWASKFDTEATFVIFDGKLSKDQKVYLEDFLKTPFNELVEKFKTSSFTKYIISIINPKLKQTALNNTIDKPIEGLVFKFSNSEFLAKVVDPVFTQIARDKALDRHKDKKSSDDFGLVIYTFINWVEENNILDKYVANGEEQDEKYLDLMSRVITEFIQSNIVLLRGMNIEKPEFAKAPEFALNTRMLKSKEVVDFIRSNSEFEEIFKMLLSGFRKIRKRKTNLINDNLKNQMNLTVKQIKEVLDKTNESFISFKKWKQLQK